MEDHCAGEAEARVLLTEPEQETGHAEQDGEPRSEDRVDLLACVEPPLRSLASAEPQQVVPQAIDGYWENLGYDRDAWVGRSNGYSS